MCGCLSCAALPPATRDLAYNPGMCPVGELNQQLLASQADTQSTEPHQPGLTPFLFVCFFKSSPKGMLIDLRERGRERKKERNINVRNSDWLLLIHTQTELQTCNLGLCPDWELNP